VFNEGDTVVYPQHGAGVIEKREVRRVLGEEREYLVIRVLHSDLTLSVPADAAADAGLRPVMDDEGVERLVAVLTGEGGDEAQETFNRRFRANREKLKTGDVLELAGVIRDLAHRDAEKGLSTGERQMLGQAKRVLASELRFVRGTDEDEALEWLDAVLARPPVG
jgi:CarD family transcriptional regulator